MTTQILTNHPFQIYIFNLAVPTDCEWGAWNNGACSSSCDGGTRIKTRPIKVKAANGGKCIGERVKTEPCNTHVCPGKLRNSLFCHYNLL